MSRRCDLNEYFLIYVLIFDVAIDSIELTETQSNYTFLFPLLILSRIDTPEFTCFATFHRVHIFCLSLFSCVDFFYYRLYDNTGSTIHMTEAQFFPALFRNKFNFRTVGFFLQFSYSILTIFHFVFRKKHRRRRWYGRKIIINTFRQVDSTSESEKNRKCETKIMWPAYGG